MRLTDLIPDADNAHKGINIRGITADSREVDKGYLFVAIKGTSLDGHAYITEAEKAGAAAILAMDEPQQDVSIPMIRVEDTRLALAHAAAAFYRKQPGVIAAITGTNGKTSVAEFLRQIWERVGWTSASIGTLGLRGKTLKTFGSFSALTTPDTVSLHEGVAMLHKEGIATLAIEASSHGIEQHRLSGLNICIAGFTNLSRDHLDHHADMDAYFNAKAKLFTERLRDGGVAVINIDNEHGQRWQKMISSRPIFILTVGRHEKADLRIISVETFAGGMTMVVSFQNTEYTLPLALIGGFQAENALLAAGLAYGSGLAMNHALLSLPYIRPAPGRMQSIPGHPEGGQIIIDYAHTPDALRTALQTLRDTNPRRLGVVFGCGGNRDQGKRPEMGKIAADLADFAIVTDDNPRHEDPATIRADIRAACPKATETGDRSLAIRQGIEALGHNDILLIAGKGHEENQLIGSETLPFSDEATVTAILGTLPQGALI
jgi:UDP-N-acetylmuramoyl-L-alanyl-D-glutamate--2,6-diaminopimelate ligase